MANIRRRSRLWLLWLSGFIGLGAYWGGLMMFIDPTGARWGMDQILPQMQCLPFAKTLFSNFTFSGIMLIIVNGLFNTIAFCALLKNNHYGITLSIISGTLLLCWLGVQWIICDINPLTTIYSILGIVQIAISIKKKRLTT